jgi:hypothetical protein
MSWYSGEMRDARIIITFILSCWCLSCIIHSCRFPVIRLINFFKYKRAAVIPLQTAQITEEPINSFAITIKTNPVNIIN